MLCGGESTRELSQRKIERERVRGARARACVLRLFVAFFLRGEHVRACLCVCVCALNFGFIFILTACLVVYFGVSLQ